MSIKFTKREVLRKGDVVADSAGNEYVYLESIGFAKTKLMDEGGRKIEVDKGDFGPLKFAPGFDPGFICEDMQ
jgi:hypothetical protein